MLIPNSSSCCHAPILGDSRRHRLYCHGCRRTIRSLAGRNRVKAFDAMRFIRTRCRVEVILFCEIIAYASSDGMYRKAGRSTYQYFIDGSRWVSALGLKQCHTESGFRSLRAASEAMVMYLSSPPNPIEEPAVPHE